MAIVKQDNGNCDTKTIVKQDYDKFCIATLVLAAGMALMQLLKQLDKAKPCGS